MAKLSFTDITTGKLLMGSFKVEQGLVIVTASDGRTRSGDLAESMLSTETLARSLLVLMAHEKDPFRSGSSASGEKELEGSGNS
jgi:hypothetical protein